MLYALMIHEAMVILNKASTNNMTHLLKDHAQAGYNIVATE